MKIIIVQENLEKPHSWYNKIGPKAVGKHFFNVPSKVGNIYDVKEYDEKDYITINPVLRPIGGLIRKIDTKQLGE